MSAGYLIGVTGNVGSGKSTVREWLGDRGCAMFDADAEVRRLLAEDSTVIAEIVDRFGPAVRSEGGIDRAALADLVFASPAPLADLEQIVHPVVIRSFREWIDGAEADTAVVEAVKLVESGMHEAVDEVWLVVCDPEVRRRRLVARGWRPDQVDRRMDADAPLAPRLAVADTVIDNSGPPDATTRQLEWAWLRLPARIRTATREYSH